MADFVYYWFRRDLRLNDNKGLHQALLSGIKVLPVFIFDTQILSDLDAEDKRVPLIYEIIANLKSSLNATGSDLAVIHDTPQQAWATIFNQFGESDIYCNEDYEPYARKRDNEIDAFCKQKGVHFYSFLDHVLMHPNAVLKGDGTPYTVFTPYHKKRMEMFNSALYQSFPSENLGENFYNFSFKALPSLVEMGFLPAQVSIPLAEVTQEKIEEYAAQRDFPAANGTTHVGFHLRFGTLSIRHCYALAHKYSVKWLAELDWREFYIQILYHFPHVVTQSFKSNYDQIQWRNEEAEFEAWKDGKTGYPIVDAGMRELKETGYMHNRVRMIVASFLCKHLLIDWRWGEAWFAKHLLDYDLASNNGGWQWAAGCGVDAAPYFRIFNPALQTAKFDGEFKYIKKWVPEFNQLHYPKAIVGHEFARQRCLDTYKEFLNA